MAGYLAKPLHGAALNRADPLARGLVAAWLMGERAGPAVYDLAGGARHKLSLAGSLVWGKTPYGPGVSAATSTDRLTAGVPVLTGPTATIAALVRSSNVGFNTGMVFTNISSGNGYALDLDGNSTPKWRFTKGATASNSVSADAAAASGTWYLVVGSVDAAGAVSIWVNGIKQAATATNTGTPSSPANAVVAQGGAGRPLDTALTLCWNRGLSPAEQVALAADPFRVFRRRWVPVPLRPAGGGAYALTAGTGSFSLSGQAATPRAGRLLTAAQASFALSGQSAALPRGYPLVAGAGTFSLTGQSVTLRAARTVTAAAGTLALSGQAVALRAARSLAGGTGSLALAGQAVTLTYSPVGSYTLTAGAGAFGLSGQVVGLRTDRRLGAGQGAFALAGQSAGLLRGYTLVGGGGVISLAGQAVGLRVERAIAAGTGLHTLTGYAAGLVYSGASAPQPRTLSGIWAVPSHTGTWTIPSHTGTWE